MSETVPLAPGSAGELILDCQGTHPPAEPGANG